MSLEICKKISRNKKMMRLFINSRLEASSLTLQMDHLQSCLKIKVQRIVFSYKINSKIKQRSKKKIKRQQSSKVMETELCSLKMLSTMSYKTSLRVKISNRRFKTNEHLLRAIYEYYSNHTLHKPLNTEIYQLC